MFGFSGARSTMGLCLLFLSVSSWKRLGLGMVLTKLSYMHGLKTALKNIHHSQCISIGGGRGLESKKRPEKRIGSTR